MGRVQVELRLQESAAEEPETWRKPSRCVSDISFHIELAANKRHAHVYRLARPLQLEVKVLVVAVTLPVAHFSSDP